MSPLHAIFAAVGSTAVQVRAVLFGLPAAVGYEQQMVCVSLLSIPTADQAKNRWRKKEIGRGKGGELAPTSICRTMSIFFGSRTAVGDRKLQLGSTAVQVRAVLFGLPQQSATKSYSSRWQRSTAVASGQQSSLDCETDQPFGLKVASYRLSISAQQSCCVHSSIFLEHSSCFDAARVDSRL